MTIPFRKARAWRDNLKLSRRALGEKIGWSPEAIYWLELGLKAPNARHGKDPVEKWVWLRYQRACEGLQRELDGKRFEW